MLTYYSVVLIAPDGSTGEGHCLADSPEQAKAKIQTEIKAEGMDATIQNVTPICEADLRSLHDAGLLLMLTLEEFAQVLASEILITNQAVEQVASQVIAKSAALHRAKSKELAGPVYDHLDSPCYSIHRGSAAPPSPNVVMDGVFAAFFNN